MSDDFRTTEVPEDDYEEEGTKKRGPYRTKADAMEEKLNFLSDRLAKMEQEKLEMQAKMQGQTIESEYTASRRKLKEAVSGEDPDVVVQQLENHMQALYKKSIAQPVAKVPTEYKSKPALDRWNIRNKWIDDPTYAVEAQAAKLIDAKLKDQWIRDYGADSLYSNDYLEELDNILKQHETTSRVTNRSSTTYERNVTGTSRTQSHNNKPRGWSDILHNAKQAGLDITDTKLLENLEAQARKVQERIDGSK